jgi:hypothetical protein
MHYALRAKSTTCYIIDIDIAIQMCHRAMKAVTGPLILSYSELMSRSCARGTWYLVGGSYLVLGRWQQQGEKWSTKTCV